MTSLGMPVFVTYQCAGDDIAAERMDQATGHATSPHLPNRLPQLAKTLPTVNQVGQKKPPQPQVLFRIQHPDSSLSFLYAGK
jgi:hypothetical protein